MGLFFVVYLMVEENIAVRTQRPARIMVVAGEASGDLHGGRLVKALKGLLPDLEICGMGGRSMAESGVDILVDISRLAVVGVVEVLGHGRDILEAFLILNRHLRNYPPDLLVLIDYPEFNFLLARKAKQLKIPVFYYISPQVWAWRSRRVKKIKRLVDRMAVILPFEKEFYALKGMEVDFVGHPLLDSVRTTMSKADFFEKNGLDPRAATVGILPGSRKKEAATLLPIFLTAARDLASQRKNIVFLLPLASTLTIHDLHNAGFDDKGLDVRVIANDTYDLMASCDLAVAASGTVTLELAILGVPMVVAYRVSPITYFLGRWLIEVEHIALVNLVAGKRVVPELVQKSLQPQVLHDEMVRILDNEEVRNVMRRNLFEVTKRLGLPGASERTARLILDFFTPN